MRNQRLKAKTMAPRLLESRVTTEGIRKNGRGFVLLSNQESKNFRVINSK